MADTKVHDMAEVAAADILDAAEVYLIQGGDKKATVASLAAAIAARPTTSVAYGTVIPFDGNRIMGAHTVTAAITFTVGSAPKAGTKAYLRLTADGTHEPVFSGMVEHSFSTGYVNEAGALNYIMFWHDGVTAFYAATTSKADAPFEGGGAVDKYNVILIGDSIGVDNSAAKQVAATYGAGTMRFSNGTPLSIRGKALDSIDVEDEFGLADYAQFYDPTRFNIAIFQRCTNDLGVANRSATDTYATLTDHVHRAQRQGFVVGVVPCLARNDRSDVGGTWSDGKEAERSSYNTSIAGNACGSDAVGNLTLAPQFDTASDASNTTYYDPDRLHPTGGAGQTALIPMYSALFTALMACDRRTPVISEDIALSHGLVRTIPSTGTISGDFFYANILSSVAGLTVNNNVRPRTFAYDGTAHEDLTFGLLQSLWGDQHLTPIHINEPPTVSYLRMTAGHAGWETYQDNGVGPFTTDLGTELTESGDGATGYTYTSTTTAGSDTAANFATKTLPANAEGWVQYVSNAGLNANLRGGFSLAYDAAHPEIPNIHRQAGRREVLGGGIINGGGNKYWTIVDGAETLPTANVTVASGTLVRTERVFTNGTNSSGGFTGRVKISKDSGATWTTIYTYTGFTAAALYAYFIAGEGSDGAIVKPSSSANFA